MIDHFLSFVLAESSVFRDGVQQWRRSDVPHPGTETIRQRPRHVLRRRNRLRSAVSTRMQRHLQVLHSSIQLRADVNSLLEIERLVV